MYSVLQNYAFVYIYIYYYYYYYYLLQLSFHSVAVVLTPVTNKNKYTQTKQYKNTVNISTHITRTPTQLSKHPHITKPLHTHTHTLQNPYIHTPTHYKTHTHTHTLQNKLKQPQNKIHTK